MRHAGGFLSAEFRGDSGDAVVKFRVGAAVFMDIGRAWGGETPNPVNGWLSDMGIGLRFLSARASFGNILHVDLAFPINRADPTIKPYQVLVQTGKTF